MTLNPLEDYDIDALADRVTMAIDARRERLRERFGMATWLASALDVLAGTLGIALLIWTSVLGLQIFGGFLAAVSIASLGYRVMT